MVANPRENISWTKYALDVSVPLAVLGLVADIAIFVIPYVAIAPLQLSSTKRWGASVIFLTGASYVLIRYKVSTWVTDERKRNHLLCSQHLFPK